MNILAISASRNRQGLTARAIKAIGDGFIKAGGTAEYIFLPELSLERCRQCNPDGWGVCQTENRCIAEDDFQEVVKKIKAANALVFATPVYFADMTESMYGFLGRLRRVMRKGPPGPFPPSGGTPAVGLCLAGGRGYGTLTTLIALEKWTQPCGFDFVDFIPCRRQNLDIKLPMLERVGEWLATRPSSGPPPQYAPTGQK